MRRWQLISNKLYKYSMVYDANGVGDTLFEDLRLRLDGDPRTISFLILSVIRMPILIEVTYLSFTQHNTNQLNARRRLP